ncbi:tyrosine-type recombinase/integrase [[Clostridium] fimetarium]|uniref:Site-specific recombinase XerD n=1 Tax=[Clostridium] fimetarium TaxID=99656 RepID=A0A1I0Q0Z6_9FIRM|nr:site-specific integrase [[Clostridium] fimetarium]SEW20636.1 Site-specific recombinase XerD [[Clostridium] fimetarium]
MGKNIDGKELGPGISQRSDKRYSARFVNSNGERKEFYDFKLAEVKRKLNDARYKDENGLAGNGKSVTVDKWFWVWLDTYKKDIVSPSTYRNYRARYNNSIKPKIGYMLLEKVRKNHCQTILNEMYDEEYSFGTTDQVKITLHALFDGAVEDRYILTNPSQGIKCKERDVEERRVLTIKEQKTFLEFAKNTAYYYVFLLILQTGLRCGEIGGLKFEDIDFDKKVLHVNRTMLQDKDKGGFYFGKPKTKSSVREIPLTDLAIEILKNQKKNNFKLRSASKVWVDNKEFNNLVFLTKNGNPVGNSTLNLSIIRIVTNINNNAKIEAKMNETDYIEFKHMYIHSLRHTYATRCIENNMKPKSLQKILGHSSITVTMDLYVHVTDDELANEVQRSSPQLIQVNGVKMA